LAQALRAIADLERSAGARPVTFQEMAIACKEEIAPRYRRIVDKLEASRPRSPHLQLLRGELIETFRKVADAADRCVTASRAANGEVLDEWRAAMSSTDFGIPRAIYTHVRGVGPPDPKAEAGSRAVRGRARR
jgi:hypothetical protein